MYDFFSVNATSGVMVGENGTILKYNSDLFEFELDPASGVVTTENLYSVSIADMTNGVAVGDVSYMEEYQIQPLCLYLLNIITVIINYFFNLKFNSFIINSHKITSKRDIYTSYQQQ